MTRIHLLHQDDDELQAIWIEGNAVTAKIFVEEETLNDWKHWLTIIDDFIKNPMDWYVGMYDWFTIWKDIEYNFWYQEWDWYIQIWLCWSEIRLYFDKKELLYLAACVKQCIKNIEDQRISIIMHHKQKKV